MKTYAALLFILFLAVPLAMHAQSGCGDSPENSTAMLALLGSGTAAFIGLRQSFMGRRKRK